MQGGPGVYSKHCVLHLCTYIRNPINCTCQFQFKNLSQAKKNSDGLTMKYISVVFVNKAVRGF